MENSNDTPKPRNEKDPGGKKPPGEFVSDELEEHTKRFLEEVKGLAKRRRDAATEEKKTGPPPPRNSQRSSRR